MTAYEQGYAAADCGKSLSDNPFMKGTGQYIAWRNGWFECNKVEYYVG